MHFVFVGGKAWIPCCTDFMLTRGMFVCIVSVFVHGLAKKWTVAPVSARMMFVLSSLLVS